MSSERFFGWLFPTEVYFRPYSRGTKVYSDANHLKGALKRTRNRGSRIYRAKVEWVDVTDKFFNNNWELK